MSVTDNDRRLRVQYPNALYHVTTRGVDQKNIFLDDDDRQSFFDWAEKTVSKYGWLIYAIVLMSNHIHTYFRTPLANLSLGAQYLLGNYARRFNRRHRRKGHLFEGRFRCQVIENESYAWNVSRYVHLNCSPVLVDHPFDWPWSSYRGYCREELRLPWICYDDLLGQWHGGTGGSAASYRSFVESGLRAPVSSPFNDAIDGWILGSEKFAANIRQLISPSSNEPDAQQARRLLFSLDAVVEAACREFNIVPSQLQQKGSRHPARAIVADLARRESTATLQQIAEVLGLARRDCVSNLSKKSSTAEAESLIRQQFADVRGRLHTG